MRAAVFHWFLKVFRLRFLTTRFRRAIMSAPFFCSPGGFLCHNGGANSVPRHAGKTIGRQKFDGLVQGEKMHPQKMSFAEIRGFPRSRRRFGDPFKRRVSLILEVGVGDSETIGSYLNRFGSSSVHLKALNPSFPMSPRSTTTVR